MLEELHAISLPFPRVLHYNENLSLIGELVHRDLKGLSGYENILLPRPDLYKLMLSKIPTERVGWGKRVLKIEEKEEHKDKVVVTCADNSEYIADMVVGADGTYSACRQNMYRDLEEQGKLPKEDKKQLEVGFTCMVGLTEPMDSEKYPQLKDEFAHFKSAVGGDRHGWGCVSMRNNRIAWQLTLQFQSKEEARRQQFMNSEWGPEANQEMIDEFYNRPSPFGGKMGDIIDATPPELISKVFLEHKMFQTWYHGRCVLIGDACHKMLPAAGQGAVNAIQDAVVLANCLYDLKNLSVDSLTDAFQSYYEQRYERTKMLYKLSEQFSKVLSGQTLSDRIFRWILMNLPQSVQQRQYAKSAGYRPQVAFLPKVENRGTIPLHPQKPSKRYEQECEAKKDLSESQSRSAEAL
ncbi:hypothetical protein EMPS_06394 [Entomortierella parvispora]|uniref:FAD-binding domain-containing protein n=1 Tax=Entomortierella parvispora TaxID=205924 RepID=A0A9P3LX68_9FUNG|nr:hypothetical protein EMPS_06394 [Entomortierella parvispora]